MASHDMRHFVELKEWLAKKDESARSFALRAGLDKSTFGRLLNGQINLFKLDLVAKVAKATDGEIGHDQFAAFGKRLAEPVRARKRRVA